MQNEIDIEKKKAEIEELKNSSEGENLNEWNFKSKFKNIYFRV